MVLENLAVEDSDSARLFEEAPTGAFFMPVRGGAWLQRGASSAWQKQTMRSVSGGSTLKTPKTSCGMVLPSLRVMVGTVTRPIYASGTERCCTPL